MLIFAGLVTAVWLAATGAAMGVVHIGYRVKGMGKMREFLARKLDAVLVTMWVRRKKRG
jgi:hypothetical protein